MAEFFLNLPTFEEEERKAREKANSAINEKIAQAFEKSVNDFIQSSMISKVKNYIEIVIRESILLQKGEFKNVPFGQSTLGKDGSAVFCIEQALYSRNIISNMYNLATEISRKGYYVPRKGARNCLFDYLGLRRISDVREIFDFLTMKKPITALVKNTEYYSDDKRGGSHFVNIIGKAGPAIIIDDSSVGRIDVNIEKMLKAIQIAWVW